MAEFTCQDLAGSRFEKVDLTGARFHNVDLTGAVIRGALLVNVDISGARGPDGHRTPGDRRVTRLIPGTTGPGTVF
jgi:uncharacterized protein YjbI with pentapeptide repeats